MSKAATHFLVRTLAAGFEEEEEEKWKGKGKGTVLAVLPTTLDTPANRAAMPGADFGGWTKVCRWVWMCVGQCFVVGGWMDGWLVGWPIGWLGGWGSDLPPLRLSSPRGQGQRSGPFAALSITPDLLYKTNNTQNTQITAGGAGRAVGGVGLGPQDAPGVGLPFEGVAFGMRGCVWVWLGGWSFDYSGMRGCGCMVGW
jgi:hypothetical protein